MFIYLIFRKKLQGHNFVLHFTTILYGKQCVHAISINNFLNQRQSQTSNLILSMKTNKQLNLVN